MTAPRARTRVGLPPLGRAALTSMMLLAFFGANGAWAPPTSLPPDPALQGAGDGPSAPDSPPVILGTGVLELEDDTDEARTVVGRAHTESVLGTTPPSTLGSLDSHDASVRCWMARAIPGRGPPLG